MADSETTTTAAATTKTEPAAGEGEPKARRVTKGRRTRCWFCENQREFVDYKDIELLEGLITPQGKIVGRRRSGNCSQHQRMVARAIKRARFMALLSYTEGTGRPARPFGRGW